MLMFFLRNNVKKVKLLPVLLGEFSSGKLKNSENYSCFLIHTVLVSTLSSNINYCERATDTPVENFAVNFKIAATVVRYK